jgi:secretion/DNA translocation related TadE-like protein
MRWPVNSQRSDERGSATLLALASGLLLVGAGLVCALWAVVSTGHHRAAAAAEMAALSAAQAMQPGGDWHWQAEGDGPCDVASRIALAQGAELVSCRTYGDTVEVVAAVELRLGALGSPSVQAAARAGPVGRDPGAMGLDQPNRPPQRGGPLAPGMGDS